jgi:hypothetical protein
MKKSLNDELITSKARKLAAITVQGFVRQDSYDYEKTCESFSNLYRGLYPNKDTRETSIAGRGYTQALKIQDAITTPNTEKKLKLNDERWYDVQKALELSCSALCMPLNYAYHHTNFFRLHAIDDPGWIEQCLAADRVFVRHYTGKENEELEKVLGGIYLACVGCHDGYKANSSLCKLGVRLLEIYYSILLKSSCLAS